MDQEITEILKALADQQASTIEDLKKVAEVSPLDAALLETVARNSAELQAAIERIIAEQEELS